MDFFEALRKGALNKTDLRWGFAINATIEALREMLVGEPILAEIQHGFDGIEKYTEIVIEEGAMGHLMIYVRHGTDGEEVYVLVVRADEPKQDSKEGS